MFSEYEDYSDDEVISEFEVEHDPVEEDLSIPILQDIGSKIDGLRRTVGDITIPDRSSDVIALLKQIKNGLSSLETAVNKIDVNVDVPSPIVKVPAQVIQELVMPEQVKEWSFEIVRNKNGYISEVIAKAVE